MSDGVPDAATVATNRAAEVVRARAQAASATPEQRAANYAWWMRESRMTRPIGGPNPHPQDAIDRQWCLDMAEAWQATP